MLKLAQVKSLATADRKGSVLVVDDGMFTIYSYNYTPVLDLKLNDWVRGNIYDFTFVALYKLSNDICPIIYVDPNKRQYAVERLKGVVTGWYRLLEKE